MNNQNRETLKTYIQQAFAAGQTPDVIDSQLRSAGWPEPSIQQAFQDVQAAVLPSSMARATSAAVPQANGQRRGRIRTGWQLFKQSIHVLNGNRYLLRYLLMTGVWVFALNAVFIAIYFGFNELLYDGNTEEVNVTGYILAAISYVSIYFFINLYAAGLAVNVLDIFQGKRRSYHEYMQLAWSKAPTLLAYSIIQATVGMILQFIVERVRWVGWILSWILGTLWSLGTMFVIPIIMSDEKPSSVRSIKQSVGFFKKTWGENVTAKASVNVPIGLLQIALLVPFFILFLMAASTGSVALTLTVFIVYFVISLGLAVIGSFANSLINIALYYFATTHTVPPAFSQDLLNQVFSKRKRRFFKKIEESPVV